MMSTLHVSNKTEVRIFTWKLILGCLRSHQFNRGVAKPHYRKRHKDALSLQVQRIFSYELRRVLLLRLLNVVLTPRNVLDILSPNQKYNTKNIYGIIE